MWKYFNFVWLYRWLSLAIGAALAGLVLQLSGQLTLSHWLIASIAALEVFPLLGEMWQDVRAGRYGIDILAATAIIVSLLLHQYWAALVVVIMLTGGESLEAYAEARSKVELDALLKRAPQTAHLQRKGKTIDVSVDTLSVGDKIIIKPGELVPVDALIIDGTAHFDESSITGEDLPQPKKDGDQIVSGSIILDSAVTARALASAQDSQYQQIIRLIRSAASSQAPFVRLADRYSLPFTFMAYAIASAVWLVSGHAIRFLEVIIVATPCPLLLAAPIALISGMSRASKYGIIIKTGAALENLSEAQTFAFDKTGTLTSGQLSVEKILAFDQHPEEEILALAASLEQNSNHVVAQAVVQAAQQQGIKLAKAKHVQEIAGRGLRAQLRGAAVIVGNRGLIDESGVNLPPSFKQSSVTKTAVFVAVNQELIGIILLKDELRINTVTTLQRLSRFGIKELAMVTGDNTPAAQTIAKQLAITKVHAEALPADKLYAIEAITDRPVVFVGDGVNDAPVLTAADVGIALGARGSTAASESADMVIMQDDIGKVGTALVIAKRTFQIARQSILVGIGLSLVLMLIFASGKFSPLLGAVLQEVVDVVVIFNALRAHAIRAEA